jgi:two-component system sensor histidine kinase QseC
LIRNPRVDDHPLSVDVRDEVTVQAHPLLVELALCNLVDNALQHTPAGTSVEIQLVRMGAEAWLQVCDDGARHPAPLTPRYRPHGTERLGLGHKIVQRAMEVQGGRFERVETPAPFTTCFRLAFMVEAGTPAKGAEKTAAPAPVDPMTRPTSPPAA